MLRRVFVSLIVVGVLTCPSTANAADPDAIRIVMRGSPSGRHALAAPERSIPAIGAEVRTVTPAELAALQQDKGVRYAEPVGRVHQMAVPNDPYWSEQWGPRLIHADTAWLTTTGSSAITVAVIDSGFDTTQPDRPTSIRYGCDYTIWWFRTNPCTKTFYDWNGHGTHVAGIVAAPRNNGLGIAGVAPSTTVMPIAVLGTDGSGEDVDVADAIVEAVGAGARVINLSLGDTMDNAVMREAVAYAIGRGVVVVAAAGNNAQTGNAPNYPASLPGVVSVGAVTASLQRSPFSHYGADVRIAAPGGDGLNQYSVGSWIVSLGTLLRPVAYIVGTSQAAPHVSGVAALILAIRPDLTGAQVVSILEQSASEYPTRSNSFGYGLVEADRAVALAAVYGVLIPTATPTVTPIPIATTIPTGTVVPSATPLPAGTPSPIATPTVAPPSPRRVFLPSA